MSNNFQLDLEYSLQSGKAEELDTFYMRTFPHLERIEVVTDLVMQKQGIDKKLIFTSGKIVLIDEKIRRKDYGDILLEEYSDFESKKVGWLGRTKHTDYIVYFIEPSKKVFLLPFLLLQKAWIENYRAWLGTFGRKLADNKTYKTSNIAVPYEVLIEAIKSQMVTIT